MQVQALELSARIMIKSQNDRSPCFFLFKMRLVSSRTVSKSADTFDEQLASSRTAPRTPHKLSKSEMSANVPCRRRKNDRFPFHNSHTFQCKCYLIGKMSFPCVKQQIRTLQRQLATARDLTNCSRTLHEHFTNS